MGFSMTIQRGWRKREEMIQVVELGGKLIEFVGKLFSVCFQCWPFRCNWVTDSSRGGATRGHLHIQ